MLDWMIVGGGIHGVLLAVTLLDRRFADPKHTLIVDPHPHLLAVWKRRTRACGMEFLRSPGAHSLEPDFGALRAWARSAGWDDHRHFLRPYARPSLELFNAYADDVMRRHDLARLHRVGSVTRLFRRDGTWCARVTPGTPPGTEVRAQRVILAIGAGEAPAVPGWTSGKHRVAHVYDEGFDREDLARARSPVVVGGGVAAVQLAAWCAKRARGPVRLLSRSPLRVAQFDADPCYIGPACLASFLAEPDPRIRRRMLASARNAGSVPPDAFDELKSRISDGTVIHRVDEIVSACSSVSGGTEDDGLVLTLRSGEVARADIVALATGFSPVSPTEPWGCRLLRVEAPETELPRHPDGQPLLQDDLSWTEGLYVTGRPADMELGPTASNIVGAHNAAKRIISSLSGSQRLVPEAWHRY